MSGSLFGPTSPKGGGGGGGGITQWTEQQIIYVGKHGNDANDGYSINLPKLTIQAAILQAVADGAGAGTPYAVVCLDAGVYAEDLTCADYVSILAPGATLVGIVTVAENMEIEFYRVAPTDTSVFIFTKGAGDTEPTVITITRLDVPAGSVGMLNLSSGPILARVRQTFVAAGSFGYGDLSSSLAHMHVELGDVYLTGANATGLASAGANGNIVGQVDHVLEIGAGVGSGTGINVVNGRMELHMGELIANTAYIIGANGALSLHSGTITGTRTIVAGGQIALVENNPSGYTRLDYQLRITDNATLPPLNVTERAAAPAGPSAEDIYLDDGTNWDSGSGNPGFRRWTGAAWEDIGISGGGGSISFPGIEQCIFVDKGTVTGSEDGTVQNPYHDITDAENAAHALTPATDNRIAIIIYPGEYTDQILTQDDYVYYYGIGGRDAVRIVNDAATVCDINNSNVRVEGVSFVASNGEDVLDIAASSTGLYVKDCAFYNTYAFGGDAQWTNSIEAIFDSCRFEQLGDVSDPIIDDNCTDGSSTVEFFDCQFIGRTFSSGSNLFYYNCYFTTDSSNCWSTSGAFTGHEVAFLGCRFEGVGTTIDCVTIAAAITWSVIGCYMVPGTSGNSIQALTTAPGTVTGSVMSRGMDVNVRLLSGVHRTGPAYSMDYHITLEAAVSAHGSNKGLVLLGQDEDTGAITVDPAANGNVTIDGQGIFSVVGPTTVFSSSTGATMTLRNMTISDNVRLSSTGSVLKLENCKVAGGQVFITAAADGTSELILERTHIEPTTSTAEALDIQNANVPISIYRSYLKGGSSAPAITFTVDNSNMNISYSVLLHGDGTSSPISNPAAPATMNSHHNAYCATPFAGNLSNNIATPYDVFDSNIDSTWF